MSSAKRIFLGAAMTLLTVATAFSQYERSSRYETYRSDGDSERRGYSYVRETVGTVTVQSRWNGRVTARRNMPISAGDEISVSEAGRAEIGLADGNLLFVGGGTRARFSSLYAQQGEDDDFSAIDLRDGSVILAAVGRDEKGVPRIDTEDATVYLAAGSRVRVNADPRRGTVVVVRAGSAEVRTRADSYTLEAGQYLMAQGQEPPEIARGVFSRDRFDLWAADRLEDLYAEAGRSASVRYVDDEYASDVVALDDYGDWQYSSTYSSYAWVPRVAVGWTPYSYGSWYYTPIGLTWWSWDPWGWYPFHYGSWYYDVGFRHWCWAPGYAYSPAWVYWAYTPHYVGWCPVGYYSFWSPWFNNYYRYWGWSGYSRGQSLYFAISGTFKKSDIDFGGWNFVASNSFGTTSDRLNVVPGTRLVASLDDQIAISGKPIVVSSRGDLTQALQDYVREAPARIERTKGNDASRLAPVLSHAKSLPPSTFDALKERAVVTGRGKLGGPGAEELASRGAIVERGRSVQDLLGSRGVAKGVEEKSSVFSRGRKAPEVGGPASTGEASREAPVVRGNEDVWRGRGFEKPEKSAIEREGKSVDRPAPAPDRPAEDWRGRGSVKGEAPPSPGNVDRQKPARSFAREEGAWRGRPESKSEAPVPQARGSEGWRSRSEVPPAKRVIEGVVPGRRWQADGVSPRAKVRESAPPAADWRQRGPEQPAPAPREYKALPRFERGPESSPPRRLEPREYKAPPRQYRPEPQPQPREYREPPRVERAPRYSAPPAPRMESRPAPAPQAPDSGFKGQGKGHKG